MSATIIERYSIDRARQRIKNLLEKLPKAKYSLVEIMGDLYYKELSSENAV